jgi:XisH protein
MIKFVYEAISSGVNNAAGKSLIMAKDKYHEAVKKALENAGWKVTDDPYTFFVGKSKLQIDLGAERLIAAEHEGEKIAVEIKVFGADSMVNALHLAIGQFLIYRLNLTDVDPTRVLYLAIPEVIFETFFSTELAQRVVQGYNIRLIIFNPELEVITAWH